MYKYCYSNEGAIYAKGLCTVKTIFSATFTLNNFSLETSGYGRDLTSKQRLKKLRISILQGMFYLCSY